MRRCSNCFKKKPDSEFYPRRAYGPKGRQSRCKACNAEVVRGYWQRARENVVLTRRALFAEKEGSTV